MDMNIRNIASIAAIFVVSILFLKLGFALIDGSAPVLIPIARDIIGFLQWIIALALLLAIAILTIIMPLIVAVLLIALLVALFTTIAEGIKDRIKKLQENISAEARDAAIDTAFLTALGLYAGLVFFTGTEDFLKPFLGEATSTPSPPEPAQAIRFLALAAVVCSISKMLFLIPVRLVKVIAMIAPLTILGAIATILYQTSLARTGFSQVWNIAKQLSPTELFVLAITTCLLLLAIAYPFTPRGWRRIWRVESHKGMVTT